MNKIIFLIGMFIGLLSGCAYTEPSVIYKEVKVPVKCQVEMPDKPEMTDDAVLNTIELISYAKKLKSLLEICN